MRKAKIVVAMSGGVDSSVAAALLKEQGHDVIGVTLKTRDWDDEKGKKFGGCCGSSDFYDARSVAQTLGIPHYNFDYVDTFKQTVIGYFKDSYAAAETPNPCIACNRHVKFDRLLKQAQAFGADYLATGHYARISKRNASLLTPLRERPSANVVSGTSLAERRSQEGVGGGAFQLKKAVDATKDQSYVLYHLGQAELSKLMFPVGDYPKTKIRDIARKYGLRTADKPDSQEICFVPNDDYRQFVADQIPQSDRPTGPIRHVNGTVLGQHRGLPFYTVGQRSGLGLSVGRPLYVVALDKSDQSLIVGEKSDVFAQALEVREVTWVGGEPPRFPARVSVKIRYKHAEAAATLRVGGDGVTGRRGDGEKRRVPQPPSPPVSQSVVAVEFDRPQSAIAPGQAAVFYDSEVVLGGGVIDHVVQPTEAVRAAFAV